MKPLELTIQGLNSFEEEQRINFEDLIRGGLFGIFGPTGSGKSSILDALILALYDKIPRYESGSNRNFINLNSDTMYVSFKFSLTGSADEYYTVERSYKKTSDSYKPIFVRLYYFSGERIILGEKAKDINKKIIELIGLNYDDFVRAVIIPQGKFSEFLHLENAPRRTMLERIFRLEDYGDRLLRKVRNELAKVKSEADSLKAAINVYGGLSEESISAANDELLLLEAENLSHKAAKDKAENTYALIKEAWEAELERRKYALASAALLKESEKIRGFENTLKQAEAVESIRPVVKQQGSFREKTAVWKSELEGLDKDFQKSLSEREAAREIYMNAVSAREKKLPELLKKEEQLTQALKLEEELLLIQNAHSALQKSYKIKREECRQAEGELKSLSDSLEQAERDTESLRVQKEALSVNLEYRAEVEKLAAAEERISEREKDISLLTAKAEALSAERKRTEENYLLAAETLSTAEKEAGQIQSELLKLEASKPKTQEDLIALSQALAEASSLLDKNKKISAELAELRLQAKTLSVRLAEEISAEETLSAELSQKTKEATELSAAIELLKKNNLAAFLAEALADGKPCPVCGSTDHPLKAKAAADSFLNEQRERLALLQNEAEKLDRLLREKQKDITALRHDSQSLETRALSCKTELGGYICEDEDKKLRLVREAFELDKAAALKWENEQSSKRSAYMKLREQSDAANVSKARLAEMLSGLKKQEEENCERLLNLENEKASLLRLISESAIAGPEKGLNSDSGLKTNGNFSDGGFTGLLKDLRQKEAARRDLETKEEKLNSNCRIWSKKKEAAQGTLLSLREQLAQTETAGKEKAISLEDAKKRLNSLCESGEPKRELATCAEQISLINRNETSAKKSLETSEAQTEVLERKKRDLEKSLSDTDTLMQDNAAAVSKLLAGSGLKSEEEIYFYLNIDKNSLRVQIKEHEEKSAAVQINLKRLIEKLSPYADLDLEAESELRKTEAEDFRARAEECGQTLAVKRNLLEEMKLNWRTYAGLKEKFSKIQKTNDMLKDLSDLFAGKAFVEFVARKQLAYITAETSKRLRMISGGRYSLELLDADFVIKDNLNGGLTRSPRTLSGGETFVVSLCLALALSSRIQMKNSADLDLFFLDEGFGSLDPLTLETVLDSLEKLRQENLTVGLITHVEELKNRIENRLEVIPAEQGLHGTLVIHE